MKEGKSGCEQGGAGLPTVRGANSPAQGIRAQPERGPFVAEKPAPASARTCLIEGVSSETKTAGARDDDYPRRTRKPSGMRIENIALHNKGSRNGQPARFQSGGHARAIRGRLHRRQPGKHSGNLRWTFPEGGKRPADRLANVIDRFLFTRIMEIRRTAVASRDHPPVLVKKEHPGSRSSAVNSKKCVHGNSMAGFSLISYFLAPAARIASASSARLSAAAKASGVPR